MFGYRVILSYLVPSFKCLKLVLYWPLTILAAWYNSTITGDNLQKRASIEYTPADIGPV